MSRFNAAVGAAVAAGLVALYGCAALEQPPTSPVTVTAEPVEPDPSDSPVPGDAGDTAEPSGPPPTTPEPAPSKEPTPAASTVPTEQPFAVRPGTMGSKPVKASVFPVQRAGQLATVNVFIAADDPLSTFGVGRALSDQDPAVGSRSKDSVDGLRLVDPVNKKSYLPATTGDGVCACTPADDAVPMFTNSIWVSVVFAAPPADQTTINVVIPRFGTVTNVPLV